MNKNIAMVYAYKHSFLGIIEAINSDWRKIVRELNLTIPQHQLLWIIHFKPGSTLSQLAEYSLWTIANVTHVLNNLEKKKLAIKYMDPYDNRVKRVYLSETGEETIKKALKLAEGGYNLIKVFTQLGEEKVANGLNSLFSLLELMQSPEYVNFIKTNTQKLMSQKD